MDEAPLDRLNALTIVFEAMTNLNVEATVDQFDDFELEIHTAIVRLKKAGMWMRQITPLIAPSIRLLARMASVAKDHEEQATTTQPMGFRVLSKESVALLAMVEAYISGETILFSDEMGQLRKKDENSTSPNHV